MMWKLTFLLMLFFLRKTIGENSMTLNRTYMIFVSEDVPIGHTQMIDRFDLSYCLIYSSISHRDQHIPFEISFTSKENCTLNLHVIHGLDREEKSMYTIEQNFHQKNLSIFIQVSILILDVNDHVPQFANDHFDFLIKENILPGTFIGRVQAFDSDALLNGKISYTLFGPDLIQADNRTIFRIDKDTGEIFLYDSTLDYETKREYTMMVEAKDNGDRVTQSSRSSYADITIALEDVNDEKPQIILTMPDGNQNEDHLRRMTIAKPQLDKEQNRLINSFYSTINLIENDADLILLMKEEPLPANTLLALLHVRDHDQISQGFLSLDLQTFVPCSIEELSLNNRTFCPIFNFFHLSIFRTNVYALFTSRILDREQYENYIIHLIANDNDKTTSPSFQSELFLYLFLLDINDNSPVFNQSYIHLKIDENQPKKAILTRLSASDIDKGRNGTVHYELMVKNNPFFILDKTSGILRAQSRFDREECELYRLGIRAYDLGYPEQKYSSIILIDVEIMNINDHIPYFMHDSYHFQIEENAPIGKIVGRVTIADRDEQEPIEQLINLSTIDDGDLIPLNFKTISRINYSMIDFFFVDSQRNKSLSTLFSIDSQGFIHTLAILDRELQSNYTFYISMYDPGLKSYALPTYIIIEVLDENDNFPYEPFLSNASILSIEQIDNHETIIYEFELIDYDNGLNGFVSIECLNCTSIFYFYIKNSSILITRSNLTIPNGIYTLAFRVRDHGLTISHQRFYTLTFHLTHRSNSEKEQGLFSFIFLSKNFFLKFSWYYFLIIWLILFFIILWTSYRYYRVLIQTEEVISNNNNDSNNPYFMNTNNFNSIAIENHSIELTHRSKSFSQLHHTSSHCHLSSSIMNSRETILTNAATNTSYHEDHNDIWQPMNTQQSVYENTSVYQFQPIDYDCSSSSTSSQMNIQRPIPISNTSIDRSKKSQPYGIQPKRNSTINIDTTIRSYGLPRSMTSEHLANHPPNRLYYYPSVQDVLDALNRRSFDKESFV